MIDAFAKAFIGALTDPLLLIGASAAGWLLSDRLIRAVATIALAVILTELILSLLGETEAVWSREEIPYIAGHSGALGRGVDVCGGSCVGKISAVLMNRVRAPIP